MVDKCFHLAAAPHFSHNFCIDFTRSLHIDSKSSFKTLFNFTHYIMPGEGLKVGTTDYEAVKEQIKSGHFDVSIKIPHKEIMDYNETAGTWAKGRYEYGAFATSVRNMVNQHNLKAGGSKFLFICKQPFDYSFNDLPPSTPLSSEPQAPTEPSVAPPTPSTPGYAFPSDYVSRTDAGGELVKNADDVIVLEFQDSDWMDSRNDRRYSLYIQNPPGVDSTFTDVKVVGDSLHVTYSEVPEMNSTDFPMLVDTHPDGSQFFDRGSSLVKGWEKSQKKKRPKGSNQVRTWMQKIPLPFPCEKQLCDFEVPYATRWKSCFKK